MNNLNYCNYYSFVSISFFCVQYRLLVVFMENNELAFFPCMTPGGRQNRRRCDLAHTIPSIEPTSSRSEKAVHRGERRKKSLCVFMCKWMGLFVCEYEMNSTNLIDSRSFWAGFMITKMVV